MRTHSIHHRGDSNENTQYTFIIKKIEKRKDVPILPPDLALQLRLTSSNYPFRTCFHGFRGVSSIELQLYLIF